MPTENKLESGQKFNHLTVIGRVENEGNRQIRYLCRCDCGTEKEIRKLHLLNGNTKSCGCLQKLKGKFHKDWLGHEDISKDFFSIISRGALARNLKFKITIKQIWKLFLKQNKKCALSGVPLSFPTINKSIDGTASLDRIDNTKGYLIDNVQWVHKKVNIMKNKLPEKEFVDFCKKIAQYNKNEN